MIITVTINPAVDKTVEIEELKYGELNRFKNVISDAGGKGINVSKAIKALGGNSIASGFIGGSNGVFIETALNELNINCDFIHIQQNTRSNLKIVENNGRVTELNEPGSKILPNEIDNLIEKLESYANNSSLFVLSGSVPNSVDKNIYKVLIEKLKLKGAKILLDADGELFLNGLKAKPNIIKPNRYELENLYNLNHKASDNELIKIGSDILKNGIDLVAISLGKEGAIFIDKNNIIKCNALNVKSHSTVGAGDSMVAALAFGIDNNLDFESCIKLAMATSAGAVTTIGTKPPTLDLINQLQKQVELNNLKLS